MQNMRPPSLARQITAAAILLAGWLAFLLLAPAGAEAKGSCLGRKATISSNGHRIVGTKAPDVIVAGGGASVIDGMGGNDRICGGGGNDRIKGNRGSDRLSGGGGRDRITGFRGRDKIAGGAGDDTLHGDTGSDRVDGGGGRDRVYGDNGNDSLSGGPGAGDTVDGGPGDEPLVSGGPGDADVVLGGIGNDHVDGGPGEHDIASYATTSSALSIDIGAARVSGGESERLSGIEDAIGGSGSDSLVGSATSNRLDGGPGDDSLSAVGGADFAFGGAGSDSCRGNFSAENSCGREAPGNGAGVDLVQSIDSASRLVISGDGSDESISIARSGGGYTVSSGGQLSPATNGACSRQGASTVVCAGRAASILASLGPGNDTLTVSGVPAGVSALIDGGPGSDSLTGGAGNDVLQAGEDRAPDVLHGGGGKDALFAVNTAHPKKPSGAGRMFGGAGSDLLVGGQPCDGDLFDGGAGGNDSASFARVRNGGVFVKATIGGRVIDPGRGGCNAGRITGSVEKIEGSTGRDILAGDGGPNTLLGRGGNDKVNGSGGHDRCVGGGGRDRERSCEQESSFP
jgi:serralysin